MSLSTADVCPRTCFKMQSIDLDNRIEELRKGNLNNIETPIAIPGCQVCYSPVGNYPKDPVIIIAGKTASYTTQRGFISRLSEGQSFDEACYSTIYSNMRENLYKYFLHINLFDYLAIMNPVWQGNYLANWNRMFTDYDFAKNCSIQLTQACNCAILNIKKNGKGKSAEPDASKFDLVQQEFGCLFKHFYITEKTKLIIFLDTPSNTGGKFHQVFLWNELYKEKYPNIKVISITHPSRNNRIIYNHLHDIENMPENSKKKRAIELFKNAQYVIKELVEEI